jgi:hypothetical protein
MCVPDFPVAGAVTVLPIVDADLASLDAPMKKYRDRPRDLADATSMHSRRLLAFCGRRDPRR